jgi:hypothetical protein
LHKIIIGITGIGTVMVIIIMIITGTIIIMTAELKLWFTYNFPRIPDLQQEIAL